MEATHGSWGERVRIYQTDGELLTVLYLEPNRRCSWHRHIQAWNQFFVVRGCLGVKTDKGYTTKLIEKQVFTVEPGAFHEFITYDEPAIVVEVAYVKYDETDIFRERLGGPIDEQVDVNEHKEYLLGECKWHK